MKKKALAAALAIATVLAAQPAGKQALLMALLANGKETTTYRWKQKTTVLRKGTPSEPMIEEVRFDATGRMDRMALSKPEERRMGPLRARKAAEIKEDVQDVMRLAGRYASPQQIAEAIQQGELWQGQGQLRVQARAVVLPGDDITVTFNAATYLANRIDVRTQYEGAPVAIAIDYRQLAGGASVISRMTVQIPKDSIVVSVESFDFVRLAQPVAP